MAQINGQGCNVTFSSISVSSYLFTSNHFGLPAAWALRRRSFVKITDDSLSATFGNHGNSNDFGWRRTCNSKFGMVTLASLLRFWVFSKWRESSMLLPKESK